MSSADDRRSASFVAATLGLALFFFSLGFATEAGARGNGITAHGCDGCHREEGAQVTLTPDRTVVPGEEAIFTVRITGPNLKTGGVFIPQPTSGTLRALAGEGMAQVALGLSHSSPRNASSGAVTFRFGWRPPNSPDGVTLEAYVVAGNGNGKSSGDGAAGVVSDFVFGCEPQTYYRDADGDGFGWDTDTLVRCAGSAPAGYAAAAGDCDDFRAEVFPGAVETCNKRDDNCNGEVDEDAIPVELWPELDGDGYYARKEGEPILGCVPTPGYAAEPGDCDDENPEVHPGAEEVCNYVDDNCNGRVDERVRPRCGVGFCERESYSCLPDDCYPGEPSEERCTGLDENCNGYIDEGPLCASGETCVSGECLSNAIADLDGSSSAPPSPETAKAGCAWPSGAGAAGRAGAGLSLLAFGLLGIRRRR